ncbi:MAG: hypothetical protein U9N39_03985 [Campylobacterota bacterium]|nr:hypothetical protein [Campylobacterota bacterium]
MGKLLTLGVVLLLSLSTLSALESEMQTMRNDSVRAAIDNFAKLEEKEVSEVNRVKKMFRKGKASGQLKLMYSEAAQVGEAYASAIGGIIKYELAEYRGFNAGAAVYASHDIPLLSGEGERRSTEISSGTGKHADMSEAFLNYKYEKLNFRAGRQVIDTPLADSDNIRMIQNSFEAYIATYDIEGFELMAGNLQRWHGTDAGLELGWVETGSKGTNFAGLTYADGYELDIWYYNITDFAQVAYFDLGIEYKIDETFLFHAMLQYLKEGELSNSSISTSIYGLLVELVAYDIGFNVALNKSEKRAGKESFSGFGGGALFTNMDTMIIDAITLDREALSYVVGLVYTYKDFEFLYAYGDFMGESNSMGEKEHIVEQNLGFGYNFNEEFVAGLLYGAQENKLDSTQNWDRIQASLNYNF